MQRIHDTKLGIVGERYDTFDELFKVNEARPLNDAYERGGGDRNIKGKRNVTDDEKYSWKESKHDVMFGSNLFDDRFREIRKGVEEEMRTYLSDYTGSRIVHDVHGQSVNVARALMGHPKSFNNRRPRKLKRKTVHFLYNCTCAWHTSTESRLKSGVILMCIAETMEKMGYQTAITFTPFMSYERSSEPISMCEVKVKDYKTRFNARKLQFPLASESVLFHVGCWWNHRSPETTYDYGSGEGICVDYDSKRKEQAIEYARGKDAIYLSTPMIDKDFDLDVGKTFSYVFEELDKIAVKKV